MTPRISVIIPTTGRATLAQAKASCAGADEVIVVEDHTGDHGYTPRTKGIAQATGTHLAFLDDDDVFTPGAIEKMRAACGQTPAIFQMDHPAHGILWRNQKLEFGNVGTPMILVPNVLDKLGKWEPFAPGLPEPGGDFNFLKGCVEKMGAPTWWAEVTSIIRPHDRKTVAVVTPWLNRHDLIRDYEIAMDAGRPDELVVVDNGSDPAIPLPGIRLEHNTGFSAASNVGLHATTADIVVMLNNDIVATRANWLKQIKDAVEPGVLAGPILYVDGYPYIDGWCLAGMREDLIDLGGFDETLQEPAYFSDVLLSLEARAAGMTLRDMRPGLRHLANQTAGPAHQPNVMAASAANRAVFFDRADELMGVAA